MTIITSLNSRGNSHHTTTSEFKFKYKNSLDLIHIRIECKNSTYANPIQSSNHDFQQQEHQTPARTTAPTEDGSPPAPRSPRPTRTPRRRTAKPSRTSQSSPRPETPHHPKKANANRCSALENWLKETEKKEEEKKEKKSYLDVAASLKGKAINGGDDNGGKKDGSDVEERTTSKHTERCAAHLSLERQYYSRERSTKLAISHFFVDDLFVDLCATSRVAPPTGTVPHLHVCCCQ